MLSIHHNFLTLAHKDKSDILQSQSQEYDLAKTQCHNFQDFNCNSFGMICHGAQGISRK